MKYNPSVKSPMGMGMYICSPQPMAIGPMSSRIGNARYSIFWGCIKLQ